MDSLRTIFFGTPSFALEPLRVLLADKRYHIVAVVSQHEKPFGRDQITTPSPVARWAQEHGISVYTPTTLKTEEVKNWMDMQSPDIALVVAYGKIIPQHLLSIPRYGFINLHGSLLPQYRGASPIQQALLQGDRETGITIMKMNEKMDEGDIIAQQRIPIDSTDTYLMLSEKLSFLGAQMLGDAVEQYVQHKIIPVPQDHTKATYCTLITKEMGQIGWEKETATEIERKLRAFTPWPGVFTFVEGKRLKILQASAKSMVSHLPPGSLIPPDGIQTRDGILVPTLVQPEGKKPMSFADFLRGKRGSSIIFASSL